MPTLVFQSDRRVNKNILKNVISIMTVLFSVFMVTGRLLSGVHWLTDIVGSVLLSTGLYNTYRAIVLEYDKKLIGG